MDGSFAPAKKRGLAVGKTKRGKGTKIMAIADASGFPVAAGVENASPHKEYEYHVQNFLSMVQLGCAIILLRFF